MEHVHTHILRRSVDGICLVSAMEGPGTCDACGEQAYVSSCHTCKRSTQHTLHLIIKLNNTSACYDWTNCVPQIKHKESFNTTDILFVLAGMRA